MKKVRFNNIVNVKYYSPNESTKIHDNKKNKLHRKIHSKRNRYVFWVIMFLLIVAFIFITSGGI